MALLDRVLDDWSAALASTMLLVGLTLAADPNFSTTAVGGSAPVSNFFLYFALLAMTAAYLAVFLFRIVESITTDSNASGEHQPIGNRTTAVLAKAYKAFADKSTKFPSGLFWLPLKLGLVWSLRHGVPERNLAYEIGLCFFDYVRAVAVYNNFRKASNVGLRQVIKHKLCWETSTVPHKDDKPADNLCRCHDLPNALVCVHASCAVALSCVRLASYVTGLAAPAVLRLIPVVTSIAVAPFTVYVENTEADSACDAKTLKRVFDTLFQRVLRARKRSTKQLKAAFRGRVFKAVVRRSGGPASYPLVPFKRPDHIGSKGPAAQVEQSQETSSSTVSKKRVSPKKVDRKVPRKKKNKKKKRKKN